MCNRSLLRLLGTPRKDSCQGKVSWLFYNSAKPITQCSLVSPLSQLLICGEVFTIFWGFLVGMGR